VRRQFLLSWRMIVELSSQGRLAPASQLMWLYRHDGRIVVIEPKAPLDERALDGLMLATDAALVSYQEQRLELQSARKVRDDLQRIDSAHTQFSSDDEIA
jgi:hypothetical protein